MKYKPPNVRHLRDMAAKDVGKLTEEEARAMLEDILWPRGPVCPHCGSQRAVRIQAKSEKVRNGVLRCNDCEGQFSVTVGTVIQGSHITLRQWLQAFHAMSTSEKGVSALQHQRNLGLKSYRSAWRLAHRVRLAMKEDPLVSLIQGTARVDEAHVGGTPHHSESGVTESGMKNALEPILLEKRLRGCIRAYRDRELQNTEEGYAQQYEQEEPQQEPRGTAYRRFKAGYETVTHSCSIGRRDGSKTKHTGNGQHP